MGETCFYPSIIFSVIALLLNIFALIIIIRKRSSASVSSIFFASLAFGDIIVSVGTLSRVMTARIFQFENPRIHSATSLALTLLGYLGTTFSSWLITLDRLIAIRYPLRHRARVTPKISRNVVICVWIFSFLLTAGLSLVQYLTQTTFLITFILPTLFVITIVILVTSYVLITCRVESVSKKYSNESSETNRLQKHSTRETLKQKKLLKYSLAIVWTFILCSVPSIVYTTKYDLRVTGKPCSGQGLFLAVVVAFLALNGLLDPMIYFYSRYITLHLSRRAGMKREGVSYKLSSIPILDSSASRDSSNRMSQETENVQ